MVLRSCLKCEHHEIIRDAGAASSFCEKEKCWSHFTKCVSKKAVDRFLEIDQMYPGRPFSALGHLYPKQ